MWCKKGWGSWRTRSNFPTWSELGGRGQLNCSMSVAIAAKYYLFEWLFIKWTLKTTSIKEDIQLNWFISFNFWTMQLNPTWSTATWWREWFWEFNWRRTLSQTFITAIFIEIECDWWWLTLSNYLSLESQQIQFKTSQTVFNNLKWWFILSEIYIYRSFFLKNKLTLSFFLTVGKFWKCIKQQKGT